jgi:hypothetical protein
MRASIACPKCAIRYVDNEYSDTCNTDCCWYDYDAPTSDEEILGEWMEDTLHEMYRVGGVHLHEKWRKERFGDAYKGDVSQEFDWILRYRDRYDGYTLAELQAILYAAGPHGFARHNVYWESRMAPEEYALLLQRVNGGGDSAQPDCGVDGDRQSEPHTSP